MMSNNRSEEILNRLGEHTFLSLWSIPNPYYEKAKEFCDLLVIFENSILIFSIKEINWQENKSLPNAWARWYRRAISESIRQIEGAYRKLGSIRDLYADKNATKPINVDIPDIKNCSVHFIVVAFGVGDACKKYFESERGSLTINTQAELDDNSIPLDPFTIPRLNHEPFVHVLDDANLEIVMRQLDTITDFTEYLKKKEELFASSDVVCGGEEELLAVYLRLEHSFENSQDEKRPDYLQIPEGHYTEFINSPNYQESLTQNDISYKFWDYLINKFTRELIDGSGYKFSLGTNPEDSSIRDYELAIRQMALPNRLNRRILSKSAVGAFKKFKRSNEETIFRRLMFDSKYQNRPFLILILKPGKETDESNLRKRVNASLTAYCSHYSELDRSIKSICGLAFLMPEDKETGTFETIMYLEQPEWTTDMISDLNAMRELIGIGEATDLSVAGELEFPSPKTD